MQYYSTNNPNLRVSFQEAVFNSMPADKGLYMPVEIPNLGDPAGIRTQDPNFIANIEHYSFPEIAYQVASALLKDEIPEADLKAIVEDTLSFDAPLVKLEEDMFVLELFHGPSLAFKDFGARFMSRIMAYFLKDGEPLLDVLVATSGDTGGAVALGFLGVPNTRVTILFPKGKVSEVQRLQLTTNGKNIRTIAVDGTFDDCQALVKQAFADAELNSKLRLTSANSINIARLIPQTFYYFNAYAQLKRLGYSEVTFTVPSGNFGNIGAGLLAYQMGLPVKQFIAATNANDTVPRFLATGVYEPKPSVQTYANAMDVGAPSNWVRMMDLFKGDLRALRAIVKAYRFTDEETLLAMQEMKDKYNYVACPHTAIAYLASKNYAGHDGKSAPTVGSESQSIMDRDAQLTVDGELRSAADLADKTTVPQNSMAKVFLSTAHACKFPEFDLTNADLAHTDTDLLNANQTQQDAVLPDQIRALKNKPEFYTELGKDFEGFKSYLLG